MYQPELFVMYGVQAKHDTTYVLNKYFKLLDLKNCVKIMDVGCGPGYITHDLLYPLMPKTIEQLIGVDISSQMVNYAKLHYGNSKTLFEMMDITTNSIPAQFAKSFDFIFSFYCIHFVKDQRKALLNMHKMLTPGGKIFINFLEKSFLYDIYSSLFEKREWQDILINYEDTQPVNSTCEGAARYYETLLKDVGFKLNLCVERKRVFVYNEEAFKNTVLALLNLKIPEHLIDKFMSDCIDYMETQKCIHSDKTGEKFIHTPYILLTIYAVKI